MTAAPQHPNLHELVDQLSPAQAEAVRAVVVQLITPGDEAPAGNPGARTLSFAATLSAEPDLAARSEAILSEIVTGNAG